MPDQPRTSDDVAEPVAAGPLDGLRVLDCGRGTAGPRMTGILADYGADVIMVEPPGGDPWRRTLRVEYSVFNRGKRSIVLDLKSEDGRARFVELAASTDLVSHSYAPGVAERLGIGWDQLHERFPHLISSEISGFGDGTPFGGERAYEAVVHALIGSMAEQIGHRDAPIYEALPFASIGAANLAAMGVLAALYRRLEDGAGRRVETSLYDGAATHMMGWGIRGDTRPGTFRDGALGRRRSVIRNFECSDGEFISVHTGAVGAVGRLMELLGLSDKFALRADGLDHQDVASPEEFAVLEEEIPPIFATKPSAYWIDALLAADVAVTPALHSGQVYDAPQTQHNRMVVEVDDPVLGPVQQIGFGIAFSATPGRVRAPAPEVGADQGATFADGPTWRPTTSGREPDTRPLLDGVRVLDAGVFYAGPFSSRLLADFGADVIKLEALRGDGLRGRDAPFNSGQAGKRAISVDLKTEEGRAIARQLVEWADAMHHNMRPGAAERLGLGYEDAVAANESLLYMHSPGWGSTGPCKDWQSFAPLMSIYAGISFEVAGRFNPPLFPLGNEDTGNGYLGAIALLLGLLHRRRTGERQYISNPQLNAALLHTAHIVRTLDGEVLGAGRLDPLAFGVSAFDRLYATNDGWICVVAKTIDEVAGIERALSLYLPQGRDLLDRVSPSDADDDTGDVIAKVLRDMTTADALHALQSEGVPAVEPMGANGYAFLHDEENIRNRRVCVTLDRHDGQLFRELDRLVRVSDADVPEHRLAPYLGEHTDEILGDLGFSSGQIAELRERHVVG